MFRKPVFINIALILITGLLLTGCGGAVPTLSSTSSAATSSVSSEPPVVSSSAISSSSESAASSAASSSQTASSSSPALATSSSKPAASQAPIAKVVYLTIDATKGGKGVIAGNVAVNYVSGDTAYSVLNRYCKSKGILLSPLDAKGTVYVDNIDGVTQNSAESGWIYFVNGTYLLKDANSSTLSPNDTVKWIFTLDYGKSEGASTP